MRQKDETFELTALTSSRGALAPLHSPPLPLTRSPSIIVAIFLATFTRWRNGQLWFTRRQQQKLRLNATVITML